MKIKKIKNIEVEARSFITKKQCRDLIRFFNKKGRFLGQDSDETVYFKAKKDLRIRRDGNFSYLILKEGKIHDKYRKEMEIKLPQKEFESLENILNSLGFKVDVRWYRTKRQYKWQGIEVNLWVTKGHGYVIELEKMTDNKQKEKIHQKLTSFLESLNVEITPRKEFERKLNYYRKNWKQLTHSGRKFPSLLN